MSESNYDQWTKLSDRAASDEVLSDAERGRVEVVVAEDGRAAREREVWDQFGDLADTDAEDSAVMRRIVDAALVGADEPAAADPAPQTEISEEPGPKKTRSRVVPLVLGLGAAAAAVAIWFSGAETTQVADVVARAELVFAVGEVTIDGKPAEVGQGLLASGAHIEVNSGSACLAVDPGGDLCLDAGTSLHIERLDAEAREFVLNRGIAIADLEKQPEGSHFRIATSVGSATAVGTVYAVQVGGDAGMITTVIEGEVLVAAQGEQVSVNAHQRASSAAGTELSVVDRTEEAGLMALLAPTKLWSAADSGTLNVTARPGADRVVIDGLVLGPAPVSALVPSGEHRVEVSRKGFVSFSDLVEIEAGRARALDVELSEPPIEEPAVELAPSDPSPAVAKSSGPPAQMLAAARKLMANGQWGLAAKAYKQLRKAHPESPEAHAALVTLGDLQLDHLGKPRAALRAYDAYLGKGGPMAQEVRSGRIRALRALGQTEKERTAIEDFLRRHPSSFEAADLRRRLEQLEAEEK
jgi:hypothetical protein